MITGTPWVPCADISLIPLFESEIESKGGKGFLKVYPLDTFQTWKSSDGDWFRALREEVVEGK
jgi:hypothetical protein